MPLFEGIEHSETCAVFKGDPGTPCDCGAVEPTPKVVEAAAAMAGSLAILGGGKKQGQVLQWAMEQAIKESHEAGVHDDDGVRAAIHARIAEVKADREAWAKAYDETHPATE